MLNRWDEALEAAEASIQRTGSQAGYLVFAVALAEAGRLEEAGAAYEELSRRAPGVEPANFRTLVESLAPDAEQGRNLILAMYAAAGVETPSDL